MKANTSRTVYAICRAFPHETEAQSHVLQVHDNGTVEVFAAESGYTTKHVISPAILEKARAAPAHKYVY